MKNVLITVANKGLGFETAKPIVRVATQSDDVTTGKFYEDSGEIAW